MRSFTLTLYTAVLLLLPFVSFAQEKSPVKFGKVAPEDFDLSKYKFDSSVRAVVISEIGSTQFQGNSKGWFSLLYKVQKRIKIINKNGFDVANMHIGLYSDRDNEEKLVNLKASTYNLENGIVVKSDLDDKTVFKEKLSEKLLEKKFTFPAVKEGSIIEYSYTINSDFLENLQPWAFQGDYPRIWSEYNVSLPQFLDYVMLSQGSTQYFIKSQSKRFDNYNIIVPGGTFSNDNTSVYTTVTDYRWVMKDVPPLKEEAFTSTIKNYIAKIEFQLLQYRFSGQPAIDKMGNWTKVSGEMLRDEKFGQPLNAGNVWLNDDLRAIFGNASNGLQKVRLIYNYVRDNFTCTDFNGVYLNNSLNTIVKNKSGSVADINLLLIAMLLHENIDADPVILSTRRHGFIHPVYPLMDRFNYVVAAVHIDGTTYYLDASNPELGFGKLPEECYNGYAMVVTEKPSFVNFSADSLKETKVTSIIISADNGKTEGTYQTKLGYYESLDARKKIKKEGEAEFFKKIKAAYSNDIEISGGSIDSLKIPEQPLVINYDITFNEMNQDMIYFNPMLAEGYDNNSFKAAERKYPVEMPFVSDETYVLNMSIPKDYTVEELPKSAKVSFNGGEGSFEYLVTKSSTEIQLISRVVMKRANFAPEEYNSLRDFYGYIVKKHGEQIVFKKKK